MKKVELRSNTKPTYLKAKPFHILPWQASYMEQLILVL